MAELERKDLQRPTRDANGDVTRWIVRTAALLEDVRRAVCRWEGILHAQGSRVRAGGW